MACSSVVFVVPYLLCFVSCVVSNVSCLLLPRCVLCVEHNVSCLPYHSDLSCCGVRYASSLLCSNIFHTASAKWRSMIGIGMLPPIFILGCLALMPESPRWLISKGKNADALVVLKRVGICLRCLGITRENAAPPPPRRWQFCAASSF